MNVVPHLTLLKGSGLIHREKKGGWYQLRPGVLEDVAASGLPRDALNLGCCQFVMLLGE